MILGAWGVMMAAMMLPSATPMIALYGAVYRNLGHTGQAGGPMAAFAPLISTFLGVESRPIHIQRDGMRRSVSIPGQLEQSLEGVAGGNPTEPLYLDNRAHPANACLGLAQARGSHVHAFGLDWDDDSGRNNAHFAPFTWRGS